jgi:hypothetical protein
MVRHKSGEDLKFARVNLVREKNAINHHAVQEAAASEAMQGYNRTHRSPSDRRSKFWDPFFTIFESPTRFPVSRWFRYLLHKLDSSATPSRSLEFFAAGV